MAARGGVPIELSWLLVDTTHIRFEGARDRMAAIHTSRLPRAALSVNQSSDGTQALIKVAGPLTSLTTLDRQAVARIFVESDHSEALVLVRSATWAGPPPTLRGRRAT